RCPSPISITPPFSLCTDQRAGRTSEGNELAGAVRVACRGFRSAFLLPRSPPALGPATLVAGEGRGTAAPLPHRPIPWTQRPFHLRFLIAPRRAATYSRFFMARPIGVRPLLSAVQRYSFRRPFRGAAARLRDGRSGSSGSYQIG